MLHSRHLRVVAFALGRAVALHSTPVPIILLLHILGGAAFYCSLCCISICMLAEEFLHPIGRTDFGMTRTTVGTFLSNTLEGAVIIDGLKLLCLHTFPGMARIFVTH